MTLRAIGRIALIVLALLACLPLHCLSIVFTRRSGWPRRFLGLVTRAMGARLTIVGRPLPGHALLVANHRSWADIPLLAYASGCAFVSKAEVGDWPVIGWLARQNGTVFIERTRRADVGRQADALRQASLAGKPVALFPEGATHDGAELLPFRAALFAAVAPPSPGVQVQPVLIDYGDEARQIAWGDGESALTNASRLLSRPGLLPVTVRFLSPLPPMDDRKAIAAAAQAAITEAAGSAPHRP